MCFIFFWEREEILIFFHDSHSVSYLIFHASKMNLNNLVEKKYLIILVKSRNLFFIINVYIIKFSCV